jgi:uncharacterized protein (TIGR02271 family)
MRWTRNDVHDGMSVISTKGDRLGKVISRDAETFVVEKGVFFPKDYELRYDHIIDLGSGGISYSLSDFESQHGESLTGSTQTAREGTTPRVPPNTSPSLAAAAAARAAQSRPKPASSTARAATSSESPNLEELRIPLMEEEIGIEKVARETGHLRIHKTIKIEEKHFSVPVMREDVVIERIAVSGDEPTLPSEMAFKEQTLDLALHEEDVRVTKHSRVREQMVIRTVVEAFEKDAAADLRHEECEIEDTRDGKSGAWTSAPWSGSPPASASPDITRNTATSRHH